MAKHRAPDDDELAEKVEKLEERIKNLETRLSMDEEFAERMARHGSTGGQFGFGSTPRGYTGTRWAENGAGIPEVR